MSKALSEMSDSEIIAENNRLGAEADEILKIRHVLADELRRRAAARPPVPLATPGDARAVAEIPNLTAKPLS